TGRYRITIMPVGMVLAAATLAGLWEMLVHPEKRSRDVALALLAVFGLAWWLSHGTYLKEGGALYVPDSVGLEDRHLGMEYDDQGRYAEAVEAYRRSIASGDSPITR